MSSEPQHASQYDDRTPLVQPAPSAEPQSTPGEPLNIQDFATRIIEGVGGLNDLERYELAVSPHSDRTWAAIWTLQCLANPKCEDSDRVIAAIIERREQLTKEPTNA